MTYILDGGLYGKVEMQSEEFGAGYTWEVPMIWAPQPQVLVPRPSA